MLLIPGALLKSIMDQAEAAYPQEACGLLVGGTEGARDLVVTRVAASPNVSSGDQTRTFEIDPQIRLQVMRDLKGADKRIIGHYHSHPNGPARPSSTDLAQAYEPEMTWLIVSVVEGQAILPAAHVLDFQEAPDAPRRFRQIGLRTIDWRPYPQSTD